MPSRCGISGIDIITADANIDLYPLELFERIAEEAGLNFYEFIRMLAKDDASIEVTPDVISNTLKEFGISPKEIGDKIGISLPE